MMRSLIQIIKAILLLILILVVPLVIQTSKYNEGESSQISVEAASSSKDNVITNTNAISTISSFDFNQLYKYAIYIIIALVLISAIYFIRYKLIRHEK